MPDPSPLIFALIVGLSIVFLLIALIEGESLSPLWMRRPMLFGSIFVLVLVGYSVFFGDGKVYLPLIGTLAPLGAVAFNGYNRWRNSPRRLQARQRRTRLQLVESMPREYITPEFIANEQNTEVRNALIRRLGTEEYIKVVGARVAAKDDWGVLYRYTAPGSSIGYAAVKVLNSTAEPDGTYKEYWLRVPGVGTRQPDLFCTVCGRSISREPPATAKGAIAWTFKLCEMHYNPQVAS